MYETVYSNGTEISPYLATAYAEGFCEGEEASAEDVIRAWSYLIGTKQAYNLQGWFGRNAEHLIAQGIIDEEGVVNWESLEEQLLV